jgi:SAM-dependent methyltransferase
MASAFEPIEWARVERILEECPPLDEYSGYYRQFAVPSVRVEALIPQTRDVLRPALRPEMRVLDVGCGHASTLLAFAASVAFGAGIDDSATMLAEARAASTGVPNVSLTGAKAAALPFADGSFDLVFSERGPLGHNDVTLREALRVLGDGGLLFIETVGEWNAWEARLAFEEGYQRPATLTGQLETEGRRLERHGVRVHTLASRLTRIEFASIDDWLRAQVYSWSPPSRDAFTPERIGALQRFQEIATGAGGQIGVTHHTLWLAGSK